jgi:hypothetical protein
VFPTSTARAGPKARHGCNRSHARLCFANWLIQVVIRNHVMPRMVGRLTSRVRSQSGARKSTFEMYDVTISAERYLPDGK